MTQWLVSWKTWLEDQIETPWDFQLVQHTSEFRKRTTGDRISEDYVDSLYFSGNEAAVLKFENEYIAAVLLATMIDSESAEHAENIIKNIFTDADIVNLVAVPDEFVDYIQQQLKKNQRPSER
jgi:Asp-tRNA(Asn)/Glu-tRNA(Gln) amidotransferase B subunit